jgi:hypothetical protein
MAIPPIGDLFSKKAYNITTQISYGMSHGYIGKRSWCYPAIVPFYFPLNSPKFKFSTVL